MEQQTEGYVVSETPPYEIVRSPLMTEDDLHELKETCEMLDLYYNSERFKKSIAFLFTKIPPYSLFQGLSGAFSSSSYERKNFSSTRQCDLLYEYGKKILSEEDAQTLEELIYDDFILSGNTRRWHKWIKREKK